MRSEHFKQEIVELINKRTGNRVNNLEVDLSVVSMPRLEEDGTHSSEEGTDEVSRNPDVLPISHDRVINVELSGWVREYGRKVEANSAIINDEIFGILWAKSAIRLHNNIQIRDWDKAPGKEPDLE